ncbi:Ger(x)C family spore germination protein [Bacillus wiedmannii]|uniref:Ger(x)C family spore germination protein n=1 Tax=Bacillus wiedmannii TaxID=1890302 RepID=UPI0010BDD25A|nr:Ger(x)C family spore germination protein [Bacillus wiedmannii]TKH23910.1 Ger(x)C family spore germination protein [Bacillus wiedmannii]
MKWFIRVSFFVLALIICASGFGKTLNIEDVTFTLVFGIDLNNQGELVFYSVNPVFGKDVQETNEVLTAKATTSRQFRTEIDKRSSGITIGSKIQVILIGKKLLRDPKWFSVLDVLYRDFKGTVSSRVIIVDGPVSTVIHYTPKNKPRTALFLRSLINTANLRGETVDITLQELHRQMYDKGITPYISRIKKEKKIILAGSSLLNKKGQYGVSLTPPETILLQILKNQTAEYSLTLPVFERKKNHNVIKNMISFTAQDVKTKVYTNYTKGEFQFNFQINMQMVVSERTFPFIMRKDGELFEQQIEQQLKVQFQNLIKKIQKNRLDPVGLGLYARAYQYKEFKQVENKWGKALSKANINISVNIKTKTMGSMK